MLIRYVGWGGIAVIVGEGLVMYMSCMVIITP